MKSSSNKWGQVRINLAGKKTALTPFFGTLILAAGDEDRAGEDQNTAGERRRGKRLVEEEPAPEDAEERDQVGDGERARRAHVGDQPEIEDERHAAGEQ